MRKFIIIALPIISITIFVFIMLSGNYLKKPVLGNGDLPKLVEIIKEDIDKDQWDKAEENKMELDKVWKKITNRTQFSSERDEINALNVSLARLDGAIATKNKTIAMCELCEVHEHWDQLGN